MTRNLWIAVAIMVAALAGAIWLAASSLSPPLKPRVVSVIQLTAVDAATFEGFKEGLAALGYREGRNITYLYDGPAGTIDRLEPIILAHLLRKPDLIFVSSTPATLAVKRLLAGRDIPVVFAPVNDPVAGGIVASLRNPGGSITGVRLPLGDDLRLEWLTKIAPAVKRIWVPYTPTDNSAQTSLAQARRAAAILGVEIVAQETRAPADIRLALKNLPARIDAIYLPRDSSVESHIKDFVAVSRARRIPLCAPSQSQTRAGALFSYGFVHRQIGGQGARLADQILRGISPADLPVETAENTLSLNLGSAAAIGLAIPAEVAMQAEEVIRP